MSGSGSQGIGSVSDYMNQSGGGADVSGGIPGLGLLDAPFSAIGSLFGGGPNPLSGLPDMALTGIGTALAPFTFGLSELLRPLGDLFGTAFSGKPATGLGSSTDAIVRYFAGSQNPALQAYANTLQQLENQGTPISSSGGPGRQALDQAQATAVKALEAQGFPADTAQRVLEVKVGKGQTAARPIPGVVQGTPAYADLQAKARSGQPLGFSLIPGSLPPVEGGAPLWQTIGGGLPLSSVAQPPFSPLSPPPSPQPRPGTPPSPLPPPGQRLPPPRPGPSPSLSSIYDVGLFGQGATIPQGDIPFPAGGPGAYLVPESSEGMSAVSPFSGGFPPGSLPPTNTGLSNLPGGPSGTPPLGTNPQNPQQKQQQNPSIPWSLILSLLGGGLGSAAGSSSSNPSLPTSNFGTPNNFGSNSASGTPANLASQAFFNPDPLLAYKLQQVPGSGFTSPFAGMGLQGNVPSSRGLRLQDLSKPFLNPVPPFLPPSNLFAQTYAQGLRQLQGH